MSGLFGYVSSLFGRQVRESSEAATQEEDEGPCNLDESRAGGRRLFEYPGTLYLLKGKQYCHMCEPGAAQLVLEQVECEDDGFLYAMHILDTASGSYHMSQDIADGLQMSYKYQTASVHWYTMIDDNVQSFAFRMDKKDAAKKFIEAYNQCVYSSLIGEPIPESFFVDDDFHYMASAFCSEVPADVEGENDVDEDKESQVPQQPDTEDADEAVFEYDDNQASRSSTGDGVNCCFADSVQYNRTVVVKQGAKGECILQAHGYDEQGYDPNGSEQFTIQGLGAKPTAIVGKDAFLTDGETKLMMLNKNDNSRVIEVDLTAGRVVQEYQPGLEYAMQGATSQHKRGAQNPHLLACLGTSAAFTIDTRLDPSKCAVVEDGKDLTAYTHTLRANQKFTCHATSEQGHLAIGDMCGQIRLFSGPPGAKKLVGKGHFPKTAKTLLKGTPNGGIIHLDITADGAYILATCDKYLLVLCTLYMDGPDKMSNGFTGRMGKEKPKPLRLELNPYQKQSLGGADKVHFSKATFQSNAAGEQWIAAACGPLLVTWNFASVRRALDNHTNTTCELKNERSILKSVDMGAREAITFMTDKEVGMEVKSQNATRRGKSFMRFQ